MPFSRTGILKAIIGQSQQFPTCNIKSVGNETAIYLNDAYGKPKYIFKCVIPYKKEAWTYLKIWEYLTEHPEVILTHTKTTPSNKTVINL